MAIFAHAKNKIMRKIPTTKEILETKGYNVKLNFNIVDFARAVGE